MPRSATDATRFTSTTPHASKPISKPTSAAHLPSRNTPPRKPAGKTGAAAPAAAGGETPLEKVKRLRAAADRARDAQVSTFDKVLVRGRVWADRAHRFTALTLIGATFIAGGVTVYALGDMMIYNRKKRAQFFAEQKAIHANAIHKANEAISAGTASEDQLAFINRENEHDAQLAATAKAKAEKKGIFKRGREWLFSGLKKEDSVTDGASAAGLTESGTVGQVRETIAEKSHDVVSTLADKKVDITEKAKQAFSEEKERQRRGGPLDQLGTKDFEEEQPKSGGWTSFMVRR